MNLLQTIKDFHNADAGLPASISKCELFSDEENVRILLRISLKKFESVKSVYADVCCYSSDGTLLSVMERVAYIEGGMLLELPSLMTAGVALVLREATLQGGTVWRSDAEIPKSIGIVQAFDKTAQFDSAEIIEKLEEEPIKLTRSEKRELRRALAEEEAEIRRMIKTDPKERRKRWIARIVTLVVVVGAVFGAMEYVSYKDEADTVYKKAMNLYNSGKFEEATAELEAANGYFFFGEKQQELDWCLAMAYARQRDFYNAAKNFRKQVGYKECAANYRSIAEAFSGIVAAGSNHTVALVSNGSVIAAGDNKSEQCSVDEWSDMTEVAAGGNHTVALNRDRKVVATGDNSKKQCKVEKWKNIIDIAAGYEHTVGVEADGRVIATGDNTYGQCEIDEWTGIISVAAGATHTVGIRIDGRVVATGDNSKGQCNVEEWFNVMQVAAGNGFTAGLTYDGRILLAGEIKLHNGVGDVLFIGAGDKNLLIVKTDGHVLAEGGNESGQNATSLWQNIAVATGGGKHSVGIGADGSVSVAGLDDNGQTSLSAWRSIGIPKQTVRISTGE